MLARGVGLPWVSLHPSIYVAVIWCSGVAEIYACRWGAGLPWVSVHSSICGSDLV